MLEGYLVMSEFFNPTTWFQQNFCTTVTPHTSKFFVLFALAVNHVSAPPFGLFT